jgi:alpha-tubulin suppressor-like RCC1 family protein
MKACYVWLWVILLGFFSLPSAAAGAVDKPLISGGNSHTLGIQKDGTLWAWGDNTYGQLGLGDHTEPTIPTQVGTGWVYLAAGWVAVTTEWFHSLGLKADGSLWAWGDNTYGQLGLGDTTQQTIPTEVGRGWVAVAAGWFHSLGLKADGSLWAWGDNGYGQLGLGDTTECHSPTQVGTG